MTDKENLKKRIIYRSAHRGSKEMDLLLGNFVNKYINEFSYDELKDLEKLLLSEDDSLYKIYFDKSTNLQMPNTKVLKMLKNFKF